MSNFPKVLVSRREMGRGLALLLGAGAALGIGMSASKVQAQSLRDRPQVAARVQQNLSVQMPEVVLISEQRVVSDQRVGSEREIVLAVRVGGNVAMRLEVAPAEGQQMAMVRDVNGEWSALDHVVIVAREARGNLRDVRVLVRMPAASAAADLPIVRAVADR